MTTDRFARHVALDGIGRTGQERLRTASVLIVGLGGLGSPVARYLAAAGVGNLVLCDPGHVDAPDLQRQILFGQADLGSAKADVAAARLRDAYPDVTVGAVTATFDASMVDDHAVVVDGTDESGTRAYIHQACVAAGVPLVWGALEGWEAQLCTVVPGGPCLRCLWPEPADAPACEDVGVFGPVAGIAGTMMAAEACRAILDAPVLSGRLLVIDGLHMAFEQVPFSKRAACACNAATK